MYLRDYLYLYTETQEILSHGQLTHFDISKTSIFCPEVQKSGPSRESCALAPTLRPNVRAHENNLKCCSHRSYQSQHLRRGRLSRRPRLAKIQQKFPIFSGNYDFSVPVQIQTYFLHSLKHLLVCVPRALTLSLEQSSDPCETRIVIKLGPQRAIAAGLEKAIDNVKIIKIFVPRFSSSFPGERLWRRGLCTFFLRWIRPIASKYPPCFSTNLGNP